MGSSKSKNQLENPNPTLKLYTWRSEDLTIPDQTTGQRQAYLHSVANGMTNALRDRATQRRISQSGNPQRIIGAMMKARDTAVSLQDVELQSEPSRLSQANTLINNARDALKPLMSTINEDEERKMEEVVDELATGNVDHDQAVLDYGYHHGTFGGSYDYNDWQIFMQNGGQAQQISNVIQDKCGAAYTQWVFTLILNNQNLREELEPTIATDFRAEFVNAINHLSATSEEAQRQFLVDFIGPSRLLWSTSSHEAEEEAEEEALGPRCSRFLKNIQKYHYTSYAGNKYNRLSIAAPAHKKAVTGAAGLIRDIPSLIEFIETDPRFKHSGKVTTTTIKKKAKYIVDQLNIILSTKWDVPDEVHQAIFSAFERATGGEFDELEIMGSLASKIELVIENGFDDRNTETDPSKPEYRPIIEDIKTWVSATGGGWESGMGFAPIEATSTRTKEGGVGRKKRLRAGTKAIKKQGDAMIDYYDNFDSYFNNNDGVKRNEQQYLEQSWNVYTDNDMRVAMFESGSIGFMVGLLSGCCILGLILCVVIGYIFVTTCLRKQNQTHIVLESIVCQSEEDLDD